MPAPHRILLIDDDPVVLRLMQSILDVEFEVDAVSDPGIALGLLARKVYDCVLTDWLMGAQDGSAILDAVTSIRADLRPTVIVLTAGDAITIGSEAHHLGAMRVIKKPIAAPLALACVREALSRHDRGTSYSAARSVSELTARQTTRLPAGAAYGRRSKSIARTRLQDKTHVLLVDDCESSCAILASVLTQRYAVRIAHTMGEAQKIIGEQRLDLVLSEWMIGLTDASRMISALRARPGSRIPVIIQTWDKSGKTRDAAEDAGAWLTLSKPVSIAELEKQIQCALMAQSSRTTASAT